MLNLEILAEPWGRMYDNYRKTELTYLVNSILTALGEYEGSRLKRDPYSPSGYVHPDEDYGCVEITDDLMFLINFETATVLSFGLFRRREIGQLPEAVFQTFIGLPAQNEIDRLALQKLKRLGALWEILECISQNLSEKDFPESMQDYAKHLRMCSLTAQMGVENGLDLAENKLNKSEPKYGAIFIAVALYTAFLYWAWNW